MSRVVAAGGLAVVDGDVLVAFRRVNDHETAAADVSGARIGYGQRKAGGDRGIDRIAALPQDIGAYLCSDLFLRHDHAVFGNNAMNGVGGERYVFASFLLGRRGQAKRNKQCDCHE